MSGRSWLVLLGFSSWLSSHPPAGRRAQARPFFQAPLPLRGRGAWKNVKRCAIGNARRLIRRGIDPGSTHLEGGNPFLRAGTFGGSNQSWDHQSAALIRRRLCGGDWRRSKVHSDDRFLPQSLSGLSPSHLAVSPVADEDRPSVTMPDLPAREHHAPLPSSAVSTPACFSNSFQSAGTNGESQPHGAALSYGVKLSTDYETFRTCPTPYLRGT